MLILLIRFVGKILTYSRYYWIYHWFPYIKRQLHITGVSGKRFSQSPLGKQLIPLICLCSIILCAGIFSFETLIELDTMIHPGDYRLCQWQNADGEFMPHTIGHDLIELDSHIGANSHDFLILNNTLTSSRDYLLEHYPALFTEKKELYSKDDARRIVRALYRSLYEQGYRVYPNNNMFYETLRNKVMDCDMSAYLTLSVARVFKLPMYPVLVPGHMFVRFYLNEKTYVNVETQGGWLAEEDAHYVKDFKVKKSDIASGFHMGSMDRWNIMSRYATMVSWHVSRSRKDFYSFRFKLLKKALEDDPTNRYARDILKREFASFYSSEF